jgi:hypothetical protein
VRHIEGAPVARLRLTFRTTSSAKSLWFWFDGSQSHRYSSCFYFYGLRPSIKGLRRLIAKRGNFVRSKICFALFCLSFLAKVEPVTGQAIIELEKWQVSLDQEATFQAIEVPGTIEDQLDPQFDGVSIYVTNIPPIQTKPQQRAVLKFHGIATHARVLIDGKQVTEHLGAWTPFEVDITELVVQHERHSSESEKFHQLKVIVDEKVGHNTQGFLPIITNHFGGIWKPVTLNIVNATSILEDQLAIFPQVETHRLNLQLPVRCRADCKPAFSIKIAQLDSRQEPGVFQELDSSLEEITAPQRLASESPEEMTTRTFSANFTLPFAWKLWSPEAPQLYLLKIETWDQADHNPEVVELRFGVKDFRAEGDAFLLNGHPYSIRGILNWGYAPPSVSPSLDENWMRQEIEFAQSRGFNLMKFCLWIPPKRYLELCDEMGMLAWVEYPTWHPKLDQQHVEELVREYTEFFAYDRNHVSIVLRSLTCETGPGADLTVIRRLYDLCKTMIPEAVVEDDSSWISWNRIHDFYDDHPYGNNHTWVETLTRLRKYIAQRERKPLALGEAMAADSWTVSTDDLLKSAASDAAHGVWFAAANRKWIEQFSEIAKKRNRLFLPDLLEPHSIHYGQLMRKCQIEAFHREIPTGAYVVSVIRDFPKAAMGLIDYQNRPKHSTADWDFHGAAMVLMETEKDRRSFTSKEVANLKMIGKDLETQTGSTEISVTLLDSQNTDVWNGVKAVDGREVLTSASFQIPMPEVTEPQRFRIRAIWKRDQNNGINEWPVWVFPAPEESFALQVHPSAKKFVEQYSQQLHIQADQAAKVILTRQLDPTLLQALEDGAKVFLIPDSVPNSFPLDDHWFLRGSVAVFEDPAGDENDKFTTRFDHHGCELNSILELQHFDLAGPVVSNLGHYQELIDPLILLWDNHDLREVRTHGLAFRMEFGRGGVLFVSPLNFVGHTNSAGQWLFHHWLRRLDCEQESDLRMDAETRQSTTERFRKDLNRRTVDLHREAWQFQPDREAAGVKQSWFRMDFDDSSWALIRIGQHWENQGYANLDYWAWYRKTVELPLDWESPATYLNINGIDDYADIYINGTKIASVGDIEKKETAFETRVSIDISSHIQLGEPIQITVAVYDWYGSGGIFRPLSIATEPLSKEPPILK